MDQRATLVEREWCQHYANPAPLALHWNQNNLFTFFLFVTRQSKSSIHKKRNHGDCRKYLIAVVLRISTSMNFSSTLTISMFIFRSLCSLSFSTSQRCILFKGRKKNHPRYIFTRSDFHDVHSTYRTKTTPTETYKRGEQKTGDKNKKHA